MRKFISVGLVIAFFQFLLPISILAQPKPPAISKAIEQQQGFTFGVIISPQGKSGEESLQFQVPPNTRTLFVTLQNLRDPTKEAENVIVTVRQPNGNIIGKESDENQAGAKAGLKPFPRSTRLEQLFKERRARTRKKVRREEPTPVAIPVAMSPGDFLLDSGQEDDVFEKEIESYMKKVENQNRMGKVFFQKKRAQNQGLGYLTIHGPTPGAWTVNVKAIGNPIPFQVSVVIVPKKKPKTTVKMGKVRGVITKVEEKIKQDYPLYSPWGCKGCCECKNYVKVISTASFLFGFATLVASGGLAAYAGAWGTLGEIFYAMSWVYGFYVGMAKFVMTIVDWALGEDLYGIFWGFPNKVCKMFRRC